MPSNSRPKAVLRWVIILVIVLVSMAALSVGVGLYQAKQFRQMPRYTEALRLLRGRLPNEVIARAFLFRSGTPRYMQQLRGWAYKPSMLADNAWNRWIISRDAKQMSTEDRAKYLPTCGVTLDVSIVATLVQDLRRDQFWAIPAISRASSGKEYVNRWVRDNIVAPHDRLLFIAAASYLFQTADGSPIKALNEFWPQCDSIEKRRLLDEMATALNRSSDVAPSVVQWLDSVLSVDDNIGTAPELSALLGSLANHETLNAAVADIVLKHRSRINPQRICDMLTRLSSERAAQCGRHILSTTLFVDTAASIQIFRGLALRNREAAEDVAKSVLEGPDCTLKKGVIVALVNCSSSLGLQHIDDAYRGAARRPLKFESRSGYMVESAALSSYEEIARHGYLETGKRWPPAYVKGLPFTDEVLLWGKFIDSFPWFPGTDDAFYRMAYRQFADSDYLGALSTIQDYFAADLVDNDIRPFMCRLLDRVAVTLHDMPTLVSLPEFLVQLHVIATQPSVGQFLLDTEAKTDSLASAVRWFLASSDCRKYLLLSDSELLKVDSLLRLTQSLPYSPRLQAAYELLSSAVGSEELARILYLTDAELGRFEIAGDSAENARYSDVAARLSGQLSIESSDSLSHETGALVWSLFHFQMCWMGDLPIEPFEPAFKLLRQFRDRAVPSGLAEALEQVSQRYALDTL